MKRSLKWGLIGASVVSVVATGAFLWHRRPVTREFYTDADTIRTPRAAARVRDVLWQPPIKLSEIVNTSTEDYEPRLSWDGLTLFFVRGKAGENADIFISKRTPAGWTEPQPLVEINSPYEDLGPEPSADGTLLYFYSDRPGGQGGYDLWVSRRAADAWQPPTNLGPLVNSEYNDYGPASAPDGKTIYFASNRPRPDDTTQPDPDAWPATVREDLFRRTYDLFAAPITERGAGQAQALDVLNTPHNEGVPCVSPAGDFLYFSSDRPGGLGGFDLYRARRTRDALELPTNLGPTLNTPANELDPGLTHLGYAIYFSSDRPARRLQPDRPNDYDLYYTSSREVFLDTERQTAPPINWAALWRQVLPNLAWALLALLLLLLLWVLAGGVRSGKLSLLARCLIASLMLHMLLMIAFNFWKVTASVVTAFRERGEIRVALASATQGDDIAAQIRGQLTEVTLPEVPDVVLARHETPLETTRLDATATLALDLPRIEVAAQPEVRVSASEAPSPVLHTSPSEVEVRVSRDSVRELPELTLPRDTARIHDNEPQLVMPTAAIQEAQIERPVAPVPTTQPVALSKEIALAPAEMSSDKGADMKSLAATPAARNAAPQTETSFASRLPVATLDELPSLQVALPGDSARDEEVVEAPLRVATAATHARRHAVPAFSASEAAENRRYILEPDPGQLPSDDSSLAAEVDLAPAESNPRSASPASTIQTQQQAAALPHVELALPTLEEAPSEEGGEAAPSVPAVASNVARPPIAEYATETDSSLSEPPVALVPDSTPISSSDAHSLFDPNSAARYAAVARAPSPALPVHQPPTGRSERLAFDLRLPDETESPPSGQDAGHGRAPIEGRVTDSVTGEPLGDATVRLDLPDTDPVTATTDAEGRYALAVPLVPDNFALSASHEDYVPASANIPAAALMGATLIQDFELEPQSDSVIALEAEPTVHHLGNDRWEGRINSQFQKTSEGRWLIAGFELSPSQLPPNFTSAAVTLLAKGVQCPHQIFINRYRLRQRLDSSPRDGSFGEFTAPFPPEILVEGTNVIHIRAVSCAGDLDDFEFVNVRIILSR